jgi:hypothetical protein
VKSKEKMSEGNAKCEAQEPYLLHYYVGSVAHLQP